jgi:hypothetical protein
MHLLAWTAIGIIVVDGIFFDGMVWIVMRRKRDEAHQANPAQI